VTAEALIQRDDDKEATVKKRLQVYHEQTMPLVTFYSERAKQGQLKFSSVAGVGAVSEITEKVFAALS